MSNTENDSASIVLRDAYRYRRVFEAYAYGFLGNWAQAQDAVQEAFIAIVGKADEYDPRKGGNAWFKKFVYFKVREALAIQGREVATEAPVLEDVLHATWDEGADERMVERLEHQTSALRACMGKLRKKHQALLVDFYWNRINCEQLAARTQANAVALRRMLSRLREKLRGCIQKQLGSREGIKR